MLLTGAEPRFLAPEPAGRPGGSASQAALWRPASKIAGRYLAPYLADRDRARDRDTTAAPPPGFEPVEIRLEAPAADPTGTPAGTGTVD